MSDFHRLSLQPRIDRNHFQNGVLLSAKCLLYFTQLFFYYITDALGLGSYHVLDYIETTLTYETMSFLYEHFSVLVIWIYTYIYACHMVEHAWNVFLFRKKKYGAHVWNICESGELSWFNVECAFIKLFHWNKRTQKGLLSFNHDLSFHLLYCIHFVER